MFSEQYPIDLVLIPLCGNKVIMGMDWMRPNSAAINCEQQLARVQIPSGGELVVQREKAQSGPLLC